MLESDPDIIAWPWPVDDMGEYIPLPPNGFKYDAVFQGQVQGPTEPVISSIEQSGLESHIVRAPMFYSTIRKQDPGEAARLKISYFESMQASRIAICPNSNRRGSIRYRFYEAMSMGRVSLFIGDKCVLPLSDKIVWQDCVIRVAEQDIHKTGEILEHWLSGHTDAEIIAMGAHAREMWVQWLKRERWGEIAGLKIREVLGL